MLDRTGTNVLNSIAARILELSRPRLIVAVDGVDGAGKTMFADRLAVVLRLAGAHIVRASVDGFHNPHSVRYAKGQASPEGFFRDSFDYDAFDRLLLSPFKQGASEVRTASFDHRINEPITDAVVEVPVMSILLVDGIFLHRDELSDFWSLSVFLDVPFDVSFARMSIRDRRPADPASKSNRRYFEGQQLYLRRCEPHRRATLVVDNSDFDRPRIATPGRNS